MTDAIIGSLVYDKTHLVKAYNYYAGIRDREQFRYLEENFGLGNPTSLTFTPIGRNHVNVLVGEYLSIPINPKVSCKDKKTISNIMRDKQLKVYSETQNYLTNHLRNTLLNFIQGNQTIDPVVQFQLNQIKEDVENTFVSEYEIAAQNIIQYMIQSRDINFQDKLRIMLLDLLIAGSCYYKIIDAGDNVQFEELDPMNTFISRNLHSNFAKHGDRAVVRRYLTREEIVEKYRSKLTKTQIKEILELDLSRYDNTDTYRVRGYSNTPMPYIDEYQAIANGDGVGIYTGDPRTFYIRRNLLPVYEVEWIEADKNGRQKRMETVRIGGDFFILLGENEDAIRSLSNPDKCTLGVNGIFYSTRSIKDYSLILQTADLQDKYDMIVFLRDSILANSGSVGDWLDVSMLPNFLGNSTAEQITKWLAYKKQGVALIQTKDETMMTNDKPINTLFAGYDDSVRANAIQALELSLDRIEAQFASITGVFRERIGGIEQRDAVSNIKVGMNNSFNVTKQYFQQMDIITSEVLLDFLNNSKRVYKKGITGSLILGDQLLRTFTALPKHYTLTDYDVHVISGAEILKELETIKVLVTEFISTGQLDPDILVDAALAKSLTEMKNKLYKALRLKKEENNLIEQYAQQLEEASGTVKQLQSQIEQLQSRLDQVNEAKLQLEAEKLELDREIRWYEARSERMRNEDDKQVKEKLLDIELAQLRDGNPRNDEVVNVGL